MVALRSARIKSSAVDSKKTQLTLVPPMTALVLEPLLTL